MQFITEDGTGLANATSYLTVQEADDYFEQIGVTEWAPLEEDAKKAALNKATRSIDLLYGKRFLSRPLTQTQRLQFPRFIFYVNGWQPVQGVPRQLKEAVSELALLATDGNFNTLPDLSTPTGVKKESLSLGSLEFSFDYDGGSAQESEAGFDTIELLLADFVDDVDGYRPAYKTL